MGNRAHRQSARQGFRAWERLRAGQELAERTRVFTMRWFWALPRRKPALFEDVVYDVEAVAELGRRVALEVTATAART